MIEALEKFSFWIENSQSSHAQMIRSHPNADEEYRKEWSPQPGLEREMIELFVEEMNLELPEEVYEFYQWHNGQFVVGDYANSVYIPRFEDSFHHVFEWGFEKFPIFLGDDCHYAIDRVKKGEKYSPIRLYECGVKHDEGNIVSCFHAPSLTNVMKAVAECTQKYDLISIYYTDFDSWEQRKKQSLLITQIFEKHGVVGETCGLWR